MERSSSLPMSITERAVLSRGDKNRIQALLQLSIRFGHRQRALLLFLQAEEMGVEVDRRTRSYCVRVASELPHHVLQSIFRLAEQGRLPTRDEMVAIAMPGGFASVEPSHALGRGSELQSNGGNR